jgi:hypothetical protein
MAVAFGDRLTDDEAYLVNRVMLAERMGWTLDYVDSIDVMEAADIMAILDAVDKARAHAQQRDSRKGSSRGRKR